MLTAHIYHIKLTAIVASFEKDSHIVVASIFLISIEIVVVTAEMSNKTDNLYHIEKFKEKSNWKSYYVNLKIVLIKKEHWKYASEKVKESVVSINSANISVDISTFSSSKSTTFDIILSQHRAFVSKENEAKYDKAFENYESKKENWNTEHEEAMKIILLIIMFESREHIKNHENAALTIAKLLKQYETTNLIIIDISFQKICRFNMNDFKSINEYAKHIQRHYNKILIANKIIKSWILSTCFRMSLSQHFNFYIFQLIHAVKASNIEFIIDDMTIVLMKKAKRFSYIEEKIETTRAAKKVSRDEAKSDSSTNFKFKNKKKDRGKESCSVIECNSEYHDDKHCSYIHSEHRDLNWKFFELKFSIAKNWNKSKDFVSTIKRQKKVRENFVKETMKKIKSTSSLFSDVSFFHSLSRNKCVKLRQQNEKFKVDSARRINRIKNRDSKFYLNNETDIHIAYDKSLFNEIKSADYIKQIEMITDTYAEIKEIKSIIINLNINDKKIINTIIDVEYVSDTQYNFISTNLLCRKSCKTEHDNEIYILTDKETDDIFMTDIMQNFNQKKFYTVNKWAISRSKIKKSEKNIWMQWHRRFDHLNMKNVKKLAVMSFIDIKKCNSHDFESIDLCESCIMSKMHRAFNKESVKTDSSRRVTRKNQRIHIDLAEEKKIILTSRGKRYVIIFVDDYIDFTWVYLIRKKSEYKRMLKKFILMLKAENIDIEALRCDNADENINDEIDALLKEHDIKWKSIVSHNSHQNEVVERVFRIIFNRIKACLYDVKFSKKLWSELCHIIIYLKNLSSCAALKNKTSYEVWINKKSDIKYLRSIDIVCYVMKKKIKKLNEHAIKCRLLKYDDFNQYVLWNIARQCIHKAMHVSFDEAMKTLSFLEIQKNNDDDYDYATLNFNRFDIKNHTINKATDFIDFTDSAERVDVFQSINHEQTSDNAENAENEILENESDSESHDDTISNQKEIIFDQATVSFSTATTSQISSSLKRNERKKNVFDEFFVRINNSWNKKFESKDNQDIDFTRLAKSKKNFENIVMARDFAARIRKFKSTAYVIFQTFENVLIHLDKKFILESMREKINHHKKKEIWRLMLSSSNSRIIDDRWVFAIKKNAENNIVRWKARWMTKDFRQRAEVDYFEIYSEIVKIMIWQLIFALIIKYDYEIHHVDIITAFLESTLNEKIYVKQSKKFEKIFDLICFLLKALYDLKQSPRVWYDILKNFMLKKEFVRLHSDYSMFLHFKIMMIITIYVNDLLIADLMLNDIIDFKKSISKRFRIKNLNFIFFYLNVKITKDRINKIMHLS